MEKFLIKIKDSKDSECLKKLEKFGDLKLVSKFLNIYSLEIDNSAIEEIKSIDGVIRIESNKDGVFNGTYKPIFVDTFDNIASYNKALQYYNGLINTIVSSNISFGNNILVGTIKLYPKNKENITFEEFAKDKHLNIYKEYERYLRKETIPKIGTKVKTLRAGFGGLGGDIRYVIGYQFTGNEGYMELSDLKDGCYGVSFNTWYKDLEILDEKLNHTWADELYEVVLNLLARKLAYSKNESQTKEILETEFKEKPGFKEEYLKRNSHLKNYSNTVINLIKEV